ncbi:hypothetical protein PSV08DRAFT_376312 [Bipolaris maydis]|nr:hypothetical protein J3E73DRAFT_406717 [Bipolaris maydis]KAJ6275868.1 hypothetical protein PSV08DRAFT_376312 [Bipolaris maydis]KAJ6287018.1 hypothetical protein J3E71DRAFT_366575 [Bipolaris maydis]
MDVPVAANVLGTMGAVCWSIQLIPQIVVNYRRHNATGLQPTMMILWAWAGVPLGVYNIAEDYNIALRIQPQILTVLSLVTWIQCYYYEKNWSVLRSLAVVIPIASLMGGVQTGLIFAIRHAQRQDLHWPSILMAVASASLLAAGVMRHYIDIYLFRTVRGISFIFVAIDALGDVFSLVSVLFQPTLDILGMVIYGTELALWIGIFACGAYYNLVPWIVSQKNGWGRSHAVEMEQQSHLGLRSTIYLLALQSSGPRRAIPTSCHSEGELHRTGHKRVTCRAEFHRIGGLQVLGIYQRKGLLCHQGFKTHHLNVGNRSLLLLLLHLPRFLSDQPQREYFSAILTRRSNPPDIATKTSAMISIMMNKVTSLDCQSDAPSAPNPTPVTEPVGTPFANESVDPPPEMDYAAVAKILAPIQESLNEAAEEAGYPSPPINTPVVGSPEPSIVYRNPTTRGRGFSAIGDRLAQLKLDNRKLRQHEGDAGSVSYSPEPSVAEDDEADVASVSEVMSDSGKNRHACRSLTPISVTEGTVPIALGSPAANPRIAEYLSFTSDDLPASSIAPCFPSTLMEMGTSCVEPAAHGGSDSLRSEGVREKSNWAEEVEDAVNRALLRLEQLAADEVKMDASKTFEEYYIARLARLLGSDKRVVPVLVQKGEKAGKVSKANK